MTIPRILAIVAASALAACMFAPMATARAAPRDADADARSISVAHVDATKVFAQGRIRDAAGRAATGGVVAALTYPSSTEMRNLKVGDTFNLAEVGRADIQKDGSYVLALDFVRAAAKAEGNRLNVDIVATTVGGVAAHAQPIEVDATAKTLSAVVATDASVFTGATAARALSGGGMSLDLTLSAVSTVSGGSITTKADIPSNCTLAADLGASWVVVGQTSATAAGVASRDFVYKSGSTTYYAAAFSVGGTFGSYSTSGTVEMSADVEIGFPAQTGSGTLRMSTKWGFGKLACRYGSTQTPQFVIRALDLAGGNYLEVASPPSASTKYCASYLKGGYFNKTTTTAITYSNGVDISSDIGIDLSSRTGFTTAAQLKTTFLKAGHLCGVSALPGGTAYQLVVKP